ncbi:putative glutathione S-transferase [Aspergillus carlsbadensis]|nr:putative glutathione S-transferase [Aspergillus carlsbadensis]
MAPASKDVTVTLYWQVSLLEQSRAHRILWLLEELNIPYGLKTFKRGSDKFAPKALKDIHPLGKSPIVTISSPNSESPQILAESAFIAEYLCDHFGGAHLVPQRFDAGSNGEVGDETEGWLRYRYYMHYTEGSFMPNLVMKVVTNMLKTAPPVFARGLFSFVASKIEENFLNRNFVDHLEFLETQLHSAPRGGPFLTGQKLTVADIMMSYPIIESMTRIFGVQKGVTKNRYPLLTAYAARLQECEGYQRAVAKIVATEGHFEAC